MKADRDRFWRQNIEPRMKAVVAEFREIVRKTDEQLDLEWSYFDQLETGSSFFLVKRDPNGVTLELEGIPTRDVLPIRELPHRWGILNMILIGISVGAVIGTAILLWR